MAFYSLGHVSYLQHGRGDHDQLVKRSGHDQPVGRGQPVEERDHVGKHEQKILCASRFTVGIDSQKGDCISCRSSFITVVDFGPLYARSQFDVRMILH